MGTANSFVGLWYPVCHVHMTVQLVTSLMTPGPTYQCPHCLPLLLLRAQDKRQHEKIETGRLINIHYPGQQVKLIWRLTRWIKQLKAAAALFRRPNCCNIKILSSFSSDRFMSCCSAATSKMVHSKWFLSTRSKQDKNETAGFLFFNKKIIPKSSFISPKQESQQSSACREGKTQVIFIFYSLLTSYIWPRQ